LSSLLLIPGATVLVLLYVAASYMGGWAYRQCFPPAVATNTSGDIAEVRPLGRLSGSQREDSTPLLTSDAQRLLEGQASATPARWTFGLYLWMYVLYFLYFEMARRALEVFNCPEEPLTGVPYMQNLPWLRCSLYAPLALPPITLHGQFIDVPPRM
jgi:hypothetical protein